MSVTRNIFQKIPFIRITSLFLAGILLGYYFQPDDRIIAVILVSLISALILFWHNSSYVSGQLQNTLLAITIILSGVFYPKWIDGNNESISGEKDYYLAEVCQKPAEKAKTYQTILLIQNEKFPNAKKVVAYFSKEGFDSTITTGNQLIILARPQLIKNTGNPFEFDYQKMMERRNIRFSVYLSSGTYLRTGHQIRSINNLAEKTRDRLIARFPVILPDREERSVVSALTLGYRTEIAQDTLDYFASTGAMHVLSVSGLHVALIYMILGFLLAFLKRGKTGPILFSAIMILFLWIYAFISGFSPPVQRATVMFTFVIIGNNIRRPVNIYNSLTASALFLILLNPNVLFDVGFQLSYLAILGIVLIQPILYNIIELTNPILKWLWALFTVSVAAQIITFPLGLFYFNQFPNLFWLSNFIVVPITTLIMWLTLAYFVFMPFQGLATLVGLIIQKLIWVMLAALKIMDAHPMAVSKGIVLNTTQVFVIYGIITTILIYGFSKQKRWMFYGLFLILALQITDLNTKLKLLNQRQIFVYNTRNTMIHLINGRTNYLITNSDSIPEYDMRTIQKVTDHLKLNKPLIINRLTKNAFHTNDFVLRKNSFQFLNCTVEFKNKPAYLKTDQLKIDIHDDKTAPINVFTGNLNPKGRNTFANNFSTKTGGAFHLQIE